jgi:hypothetical protein
MEFWRLKILGLLFLVERTGVPKRDNRLMEEKVMLVLECVSEILTL